MGVEWIQIPRRQGSYKSGELVEDPATFEYELAPWIDRGKLSWIAPGDAALTLRSTAKDCPYLGLDGVREPQHIEAGKVWTKYP